MERTGGNDGRIIYAADGFAVADATVFHGRHEGQRSKTPPDRRQVAGGNETFHEWMCREEAGL